MPEKQSRPQANAERLRGPAPISPARLAAFEILERVALTAAHSDDLLHGPRLTGLSQQDRDLTTALVLGVLRWQIALDAILRPLLNRPDVELALPVLLSLRLGAFQLRHLERVPAHAAINESVELVRMAQHAHAAGMVNAVLRKVVLAPVARRPLVESAQALAERLGHPLWLVERWIRVYGRQAADAICAFDQEQPRCDTLFRPETTSQPLPVMDAGSRLVAEVAAASQPHAQRIWDCCAAPGGKTLILAHRHDGAELLATDTSPVRLRRLQDRLRREAPERPIHCMQADASVLPAAAGSFDLILCDVPCSGTGTFARNPEIRHRLDPDDLQRQANRQQRILMGALAHLAPGGRLLYSTCSLEPEENEVVVDAVLEQSGGSMQRIPVRPLLEELQRSRVLQVEGAALAALTRGDFLRTLPGYGFQGDGFFGALFARV